MTNSSTSTAETRQISAAELARFVAFFREALGWTQETLAELSGLNARTVQRVERGESSSVDTRRALARAFQFNEIDFFNKPYAFKSEEQLRAEADEIRKTHLLLDVHVATAGKQLADLTERMNVHVFDLPEGAAQDVAETIAGLFEYMKEYGDSDELYSFSDKLSLYDHWSESIDEIAKSGLSICYAERQAQIVGSGWVDKTPWDVVVGYVFVAAKGAEPRQIFVPKKLKMGH